MAENPSRNNGTTGNNRKTSNNSFFRMRHHFQSNRNAGPRQPTVSLLIPQPSVLSPANSFTNGNNSATESQSGPSAIPTPPTTSFRIDKKAGPYSGWKLYFPEIGNSNMQTVTTLNSQYL